MPIFDQSSTGEQVAAGHDLTGKRVVITGANTGLGAETARVLAQAGADLVLAVRSVAAGREVAARIAAQTGREPRVLALDLGSLASIRAFAAELGDEPVNYLINNAGVMCVPLGKTADGFETQIGVNHFGHFLLTKLLMPNLIKGAPARVVQLASAGHIWSGVDFDDLHFERREYNPWVSYGQSKTANVLFAMELARRYQDQGVTAFAVMPGRIDDTGLGRHTDGEVFSQMPPMAPPAAEGGSPPPTVAPKTIPEGVATTIWAIVAPELDGKGGLYLEDCAIAKPWSEANPRRGVKDWAQDPVAAERLWELSEAAVG